MRTAYSTVSLDERAILDYEFRELPSESNHRPPEFVAGARADAAQPMQLQMRNVRHLEGKSEQTGDCG